jgi:signal transduction histidine kinase
VHGGVCRAMDAGGVGASVDSVIMAVAVALARRVRYPSWWGRPVLRDAALAVGLLVVCLLVGDPTRLLRTAASGPAAGRWGEPGGLWVWWVATGATLASVAMRRRWPVPMLAVGVLAAAGRLSTGVPVGIIDLAVLVLLYTVAARHTRTVSLAVLAVLLGSAVALSSGLLAARPFATTAFQVCQRHDATGPVRAGEDCRAGAASPWSGLPVLGSALLAAWAVGSGSRNRRAYLNALHTRTQHLEHDRDHQTALAEAAHRERDQQAALAAAAERERDHQTALAEAAQRDRDQQAALAAAAERERISREVHDVVAHGLSLIVIQAQGAEAALDHRPDDSRAALRTIVATGRDSLADMRRAIGALGDTEPSWHPQPGLAQLPALVTRVSEAGTPVRLRVTSSPATVSLATENPATGNPAPVSPPTGSPAAGSPAAAATGGGVTLPASVQLTAYRVVQEALTNVVKHAGPGATADVTVEHTDTALTLTVRDAGLGTNGAAGSRHGGSGEGSGTEGSGGHGLPGMRRRVTLLGGRLEAGPHAEGGWVVRVRLPVREDA